MEKRDSHGRFTNLRRKFHTLAVNYCIAFTSTVLVIAGLANLGTTAHQMFQWLENATAPTTFAQESGTSTPERKQVDLIKVEGDTTPEIMEAISRYARLYKVDEALMKKIIRCESRFKIKARNTETVVGVDVGLGQINTYYHDKQMKRMGLDIRNVTDNIEYMAYLMAKNGTSDYQASKRCWNKPTL